jgi:hypothetical protein
MITPHPSQIELKKVGGEGEKCLPCPSPLTLLPPSSPAILPLYPSVFHSLLGEPFRPPPPTLTTSRPQSYQCSTHPLNKTTCPQGTLTSSQVLLPPIQTSPLPPLSLHQYPTLFASNKFSLVLLEAFRH